MSTDWIVSYLVDCDEVSCHEWVSESDHENRRLGIFGRTIARVVTDNEGYVAFSPGVPGTFHCVLWRGDVPMFWTEPVKLEPDDYVRIDLPLTLHLQ